MKALLIVAGKETFILQPSYEELLIKSNRDVADLQMRPLLDFPSLVQRPVGSSRVCSWGGVFEQLSIRDGIGCIIGDIYVWHISL